MNLLDLLPGTHAPVSKDRLMPTLDTCVLFLSGIWENACNSPQRLEEEPEVGSTLM